MKRKQKNTRLQKLKKVFHRHVKLALVPHKENQFRPHLIRRYGLTGLLLVIIGIQGIYNFSASGTVMGVSAPITSQDLLADTNSQRTERGLPSLRASDALSRAAFLKAKDMFAKQYWAHIAPDGTTPWHWFGTVGYNYAAAGENLAKNFTTADAATAAWMSSPTHRKNILSKDYVDVGFAVVDGLLDGKPTTLVVALYGKPAEKPKVLGSVIPTNMPGPQYVGPVGRLSVALSSMTPAMFASLLIATVAISVALTAHMYRRKLPKTMRESWYRHHGMIKAGGMLSLVLIVIFLYSGGQI